MEPLQEKCLEMAEYFVSFCKQHELLCYLCGGGAIGALRHKGFIPWDDDTDISLARDEFEKLYKVLQNENHPYYKLISFRGNKGISIQLYESL